MARGFPTFPLGTLPVTPQTCVGARLVPFYDRFVLEILYEVQVQPFPTTDSSSFRATGIDLGLNNLVTTSDGLLVKGGVVKTVNHWHNKRLAHYRSLATTCNRQFTTRRIQRLHRRRINKFRDTFHHTSRRIITYCLEPVLFLELYPGTCFEVFIEVIDADGGTRCASTTVASLALADAGIPMKSLVTALAMGKIDGKVVVDLSGIEDKAGEADLPMAITWFNNEIALLQFDGAINMEEMNMFLELAKKAASKVYEMQLDALRNKYIRIQEDVEKQLQQKRNGEVN